MFLKILNAHINKIKPAKYTHSSIGVPGGTGEAGGGGFGAAKVKLQTNKSIINDNNFMLLFFICGKSIKKITYYKTK